MSRALLATPRIRLRLRLLAGVLMPLVSLLAAPRTARAEDAAAFGQLEQETLADGITRVGAVIDPRPEGKTVGVIRVVNEEVFSQRDWLLQFFNHFHRTTREEVLAREVLLRPGRLYDQDLVDETVRNLRSPPAIIVAGVIIPPPDLSSVIAIVPVASPRPGQVDLLVVTRDVWSLRFNTNFEYQGNALTLLDTSLSENNLFGWRKYVAFRYRLDQGSNSFGPSYYDPNIHGTRLTLYAQATLWYARDSGRYDGNTESVSLRYPLFSLASQWGAGVDFTHYDSLFRGFRGNDLFYDYRRRRTSVDSSAVRSFGTSVIQRVTAGHLFDGRRYFVDDAHPEAFMPDLTPMSEQRSEPYASYELFTPRYLIFRDFDTFDLRESLRLGPGFAARVSYGLPALGADFAALGLSAAASFAASPWGGYAKIAAAGSARLRDGDFIDQFVSGEAYFATPIFRRVLRVVVDARAGAVRDDTQRTHFYLGGTTGLRGYAINEIPGTSFLVGHVELRTRALEAVFSQRIGALAFWDVGGAAGSFADLVTYHDFGLGIRWLIPQANPTVLRFDWAVPTADATLTRAGFPGRFTAGFEQVFDPFLTQRKQ